MSVDAWKCPHCEQWNDEDDLRCVRCGERDTVVSQVEQIAALQLEVEMLRESRQETFDLCDQLHTENADLTAKLAALIEKGHELFQFGYLEEVCSGPVAEFAEALVDEPPANKRLRAIEAAAEAVSEEHDDQYREMPDDGGRVKMAPCTCDLCKAVRGKVE